MIYILHFFFSFFRMEETVRTLLQYKSKFEQLKQDRHSVANSYEVSQKYGRILAIDIYMYLYDFIILQPLCIIYKIFKPRPI